MESEERPNKMRKLEHENETKPEGVHQPEAEVMPSEIKHSDAAPEPSEEPNPMPEIVTKPGATEETQQPPTQPLETGKPTSPKESSHDQDRASPNSETHSTTTPAFQYTYDPNLSKNKNKKLRKRLEWESLREDRKLIRREEQKSKRLRAAAQKAALPPEILAEKAAIQAAKAKRPPPKQLPITILIDCDFDELMREGERTSLSTQITRCYSDNRGSPFRAHLTLASFGGSLKERYEGVLEGVHKLWKPFRTFSEGFVQVAEMAKEWMGDPKENFLVGSFAKYADQDQEKLKAEGEIVYLSSEAESDLTELKPYSTYIIGGLVDKNREKGLCHRRATEKGIKTMRLPIGKFMEMSSRKVLATNHVNEIMVRWLECGDWGEAFVRVIPKRKGGVLKKGGGGGEKDGGVWRDGGDEEGDHDDDHE